MVVKLADVNISLPIKYPSNIMRFVEFETNDQPDYYLEISNNRLTNELKELVRRFPFRCFSDEEIEWNVIYREVPKLLSKENVVLIHGVLVKMDNDGYLFTAPSGTGKSTHAMLWTKVFPNRASIVNGDKALLKLTKSGVFAYGSPWKGKERIGTSQCVKLKSICEIQRGNVNYIKAMERKADSFLTFLVHSQISGLESIISERIRWIDQAIGYISFFRMKCNMSYEAANIAYEGMNSEHSFYK